MQAAVHWVVSSSAPVPELGRQTVVPLHYLLLASPRHMPLDGLHLHRPNPIRGQLCGAMNIFSYGLCCGVVELWCAQSSGPPHISACMMLLPLPQSFSHASGATLYCPPASACPLCRTAGPGSCCQPLCALRCGRAGRSSRLPAWRKKRKQSRLRAASFFSIMPRLLSNDVACYMRCGGRKVHASSLSRHPNHNPTYMHGLNTADIGIFTSRSTSGIMHAYLQLLGAQSLFLHLLVHIPVAAATSMRWCGRQTAGVPIPQARLTARAYRLCRRQAYSTGALTGGTQQGHLCA